jgi:fructoselysine 6-kinase
MIIGIGDNCMDLYTYPVKRKSIGGNVLNVTVNIAKNGIKTEYIGSVGNDNNGEHIIRTLKNIGVGTTHIRVNQGATGFTEIKVVDGDYIIEKEEYGASKYSQLKDETKNFVTTNASLIHTSLSGNALHLSKSLKSLKIPLSCDIGKEFNGELDGKWRDFFCGFKYIFVSGGESISITNAKKLGRLIYSCKVEHVIVTLGANGVIEVSNNNIRYQKSLLQQGTLVDPLGAGDAFIAGYLAAVDSNKQRDPLLAGSTWAKKACMHYGSW